MEAEKSGESNVLQRSILCYQRPALGKDTLSDSKGILLLLRNTVLHLCTFPIWYLQDLYFQILQDMVATQIPGWGQTKLRQSRDWTQASSPKNLQRGKKKKKKTWITQFSSPACGCCLPSGRQKPQGPSKSHGQLTTSLPLWEPH